MTDLFDYVEAYLVLGFSPIPIPHQRKKAILKDWQNLRLSKDRFGEYFNDPNGNIAILLGIHGLTDIDCDSPEAIRVARSLLPLTEWVFGRRSKIRSHYLYTLTKPIPTIQLRDPVKESMVVELRCLTKEEKVGHYTVFPPSVHESGEAIRWSPGEKTLDGPPRVEPEILVQSVHRVGAAALLAAHWVPSGSGRHECMLALAGVLARGGWLEEDVFQFCDAVYQSLENPDPSQTGRCKSEIASTFEKYRNGQPTSGIPKLKRFINPKVVETAFVWLQASTGSLSQFADEGDRRSTIELLNRDQETKTNETLTALYLANEPPRLFTQLQSIVAISQDKKGNIHITEADVQKLKHFVHRAARYTENGHLANLPSDIPQDILQLATSEIGFPELDSVVRGPVMRPDGSILDLPGYDESTGLLYVEDPRLVIHPIPATPTQNQALNGIGRIVKGMAEFPFSDEACRANALAAALTPVVRPAIDASIPMGLISAVDQSSGKTTLADFISILATGNHGGYKGAPTNPEEWGKRITSALRTGSPVIVIDNVKDKQPLDSSDLCRLITDREWTERELQFSREIRIPNRALWLATGNNLKVGGDMGTRCFLIKIDAGLNPSGRQFKTENPQQDWKSQRGEMLAALLTAARAWFVAGCPPPKQAPTTRFHEWVRVVGGILEYAGVVGFLANHRELRETADRESSEWETFHEAVSEKFPAEFQIRNLLEQLVLSSDLTDTLPGYLRKLAGKPNDLARALANEYEARENRPYGDSGIKVVRKGKGHAGAMKYEIVTSK